MNIPAFPAMHFDLADNEHGMTLRDYFAAKALQGMCANPDDSHEQYDLNYEEYTKEIALCAYQMADAMLKAREA